jgi:hypothetical protein
MGKVNVDTRSREMPAVTREKSAAMNSKGKPTRGDDDSCQVEPA